MIQSMRQWPDEGAQLQEAPAPEGGETSLASKVKALESTVKALASKATVSSGNRGHLGSGNQGHPEAG